jgi:prevent-host-death family protein
MNTLNLQLDRDIQPLSEFRANAASFVERVKNQRRPLVLTQHGKSAAVLINVEDYQNLLNTIQTLREIAIARDEFKNNQGIDHGILMRDLKDRYSNS